MLYKKADKKAKQINLYITASVCSVRIHFVFHYWIQMGDL